MVNKHQPQTGEMTKSNWWKILLVMAILVSAFSFVGTALPSVAQAESATLSQGSLANQLLNLAQAKLDAEYNVLVTGDSASLTKRHAAITGLAAQQMNDVANAQLGGYKALADHGLHYTKFSSTLTSQNVVVANGGATVTADEYTVLHLNTGIDSKSWNTHIFHFTLQGSKWSLDKDENAHPYIPTSQVPDKFKVIGKPMLLTGQSAVPISRNGLADKASSSMATVGTVAISGTYNPTNAVNYAKTYAFHNNTAYITYQNDCTSFVSQAMNWGGWQHIGGWYDDPNNWWYSPNRILAWGDKTQSNSWIVTNYFYWFARYSGRATDAHYWSDLRVGDVIQMMNAGNTSGMLDHTMIISSIDSSGNIYITEHSNPNVDKPLWLIAQQNQGASYYGTVMKYTY